MTEAAKAKAAKTKAAKTKGMTAAANGLRMAVGTLTAIPVPPPGPPDRRTARAAMVLGPIAVAPVGLLAGLVGWAASLMLPPLVAGVLVLGCFALGSRALHLDGLADTADGLTASYDRERALEVMRRGNSGPAGAATLVLVLLLQAAALAVVVARRSSAAGSGTTRPW